MVKKLIEKWVGFIIINYVIMFIYAVVYTHTENHPNHEDIHGPEIIHVP